MTFRSIDHNGSKTASFGAVLLYYRNCVRAVRFTDGKGEDDVTGCVIRCDC